MKKTIMTGTLAATMLLSVGLGQGGVTSAATAKPTSTEAAVVKPTAAPVMTDNLFKYGLKKDVELPVTFNTSPLGYTLHKIMIYDFKSKEVENLRKLYGFQSQGRTITNPKYFIWTKITIVNNSKQTMHESGADLARQITLSFKNGGWADPIGPMKSMGKINSKEALWTYHLAPGEKLTTNFAYVYSDDFKYFAIRQFGNAFSEKYVVKE